LRNNRETIVESRAGFPVWVIALVLIISSAPFFLKQFGVDFGTPIPSIDILPEQHSLQGWITLTLLEWTAFCLGIFTALLAWVHFKIRRDLGLLVIGVAIFFGACSDAFQTLVAPRIIDGIIDMSNAIPLIWGISRISSISILLAGVGILVLWVGHKIKKGLPVFILVCLTFPLLAYGAIHFYVTGDPHSLKLFPEVFVVRLSEIAPLLLYALAGMFVFPIFRKKDQGYISHSLVLFLIPLASAQLYMVLGSNNQFDHDYYVAHFLKMAACLLPLSAFVMEIFKGYQEERQIVDSFGLVQKELKKLGGLKKLELDSVGDGVISLDTKGNAISINPSAQLILGYSEKEFIGKSIHEVVAHMGPGQRHYPKGSHPINLSIENGHVLRERDGVFIRKDGASFGVEYVSTPIQGDEENRGTVITFREIAERKLLDGYFYKALQEVSKAREEADLANKSKSLFLSIMSHEIRTPLSAILGYAQIMQRNPSANSEHNNFVDKIEASGIHLLELINDVLDISKIEAGEIELKTADFDLHDLVNGLALMFKNRCEAKDLEFSVKGIGEKPIYVHGDERKLRQILVNLLGNAVKFTNQGKVDLIMEKGPASHYRFTVVDTGNGISVEDQSALFEPFKQGKDGLNMGGTGLGLSISKELADLMGGELSVESELDKGSSFSLALELQSAKSPVQLRLRRSRQVKTLAGKTDLKALVVDDAEENRIMLCKVLESIGVKVVEAENGEKAIAKLKEFRPNIIFMDRRMPVMNGEEATKKIFKEYGPERFKIVGVTASALAHEQEIMLTAGCSVVIGKPFRIEQIFKCIQDLMGVEYEYQDIRKNPIKSPQKALPLPNDFSDMRIPAQMFLQFKDSIDKGDSSELKKQLAVLAARGDMEKLLETRLSALAREGDFEGILELLEQIPVVGIMHD
jgi:PAS domain S-box-containing protein